MKNSAEERDEEQYHVIPWSTVSEAMNCPKLELYTISDWINLFTKCQYMCIKVQDSKKQEMITKVARPNLVFHPVRKVHWPHHLAYQTHRGNKP